MVIQGSYESRGSPSPTNRRVSLFAHYPLHNGNSGQSMPTSLFFFSLETIDQNVILKWRNFNLYFGILRRLEFFNKVDPFFDTGTLRSTPIIFTIFCNLINVEFLNKMGPRFQIESNSILRF